MAGQLQLCHASGMLAEGAAPSWDNAVLRGEGKDTWGQYLLALARAYGVHLFPTLCSMMLYQQLEISYGGSDYIVGISELENVLLNIYQHSTGKGQ